MVFVSVVMVCVQSRSCVLFVRMIVGSARVLVRRLRTFLDARIRLFRSVCVFSASVAVLRSGMGCVLKKSRSVVRVVIHVRIAVPKGFMILLLIVSVISIVCKWVTVVAIFVFIVLVR